MTHKGVVACGHPQTADAAAQILNEGGNAFDAIVAAHFAACVAEPVLASLGGGGFLTALPANSQPVTYDFFCHTPLHYRPIQEIDLFPILADFGETTQEFHIGMGSIAVPGSIKGLFEIHRQLCTLPMPVLLQPAIELAKTGVIVNEFQAYIFDIVKPIYQSNNDCFNLYKSVRAAGSISKQLVRHQEVLRQPDLANTLEALSKEGESYFYQGEIAGKIAQTCREHGGFITRQDLKNYQVERRLPVHIPYRGHTIYINPPPSSGGLLIAFSLKLLERLNLYQFNKNSIEYLNLLIDVMHHTNAARSRNETSLINESQHVLLDDDLINEYSSQIRNRYSFNRGTTHISVIDSHNNIASMTVSNGEGSSYVIPQTGIVLNNMLGEQDLHPQGFNKWQPNQRISSMMAPAILVENKNDFEKNIFAMGSGGSNRIRSAILQVIINLLDYRDPLLQAVDSPRVHFENNILNIEAGVIDSNKKDFSKYVQTVKVWNDKNLFFGGVNAVQKHGHMLNGAGDPRRGGISVIV